MLFRLKFFDHEYQDRLGNCLKTKNSLFLSSYNRGYGLLIVLNSMPEIIFSEFRNVFRPRLKKAKINFPKEDRIHINR
jgi:hypothetical protein